MELNAEKTIAHLEITGELNAAALESVIRKLCILRSQMTPEVTQTPPSPDDPPSLDMKILLEDKPAMLVAQREDGDFRFWLRNRGIGWCGYNVPLTQAIGVYQFMHPRLGHLKTGPDLISAGDGRRH